MIATALIIGAVVGGVILITVVITATVCCLRRHPWLSALRAPTASFSGLDRNGSALHERAKHRASVIAARVHESKHDARNRDDMISKGDHGAILQSSQRHSFSLNEHRGTGIEEDGFDLSSAQVTQRPRDATCIDVGHTAPQIVIDAHISPKNQTMTATLSDVLSAGGPFDRTHTSEEPHAPNPHRTLVFPNGDRNFDDSSDVLDALSDEDGANAVHRRRTTNAADLFDDDTTSASRRESDHFSFGDVQPAYARSAVLSRNPISHPPTAEDEDFRSNTHLGRSDDVNKGLGQIGQEVESVTKGHTQSTSRAAFSSPQGHARAKRATVASLLFRRSNDDDSSEASASISGPPMGAGVVPGVVPAGAGPVVNDHVGAQNTNGVEAIEGLQHAEGDQQPSGRGSPTRRTIPSIQSSIADLPKSGLQSLGDPIIRLANLDFDDASVFRGSIDAARRAKQLDFNSDMSDVKRVAGCQNLERAGSGRAHQYDESHMPESFSGSFPVLPPLFASSQGQLSSDALGGLTSTASSQIPPGLVPLEKSPPRSRIAMPKVRIVQNVGLPLQKSRGSKSSPTKTTTTTTPTTTGDTMTAEDEVLRLRLMRQQRRDSQADGAVPTNINGLVNDDDGAHGTVSDPSQFQDEHDDKDQSGSDNNFNFSGAQFLNETEGIFGGNGAPPPALVPRQGSPSSNFPSRQPSNPFGHIRRPAPFVLGAAPEQNSGAAPGGLGLGPGLLASLGSCDDNNVAGGFGFGGGFNAEGFSPTVSRGGDAPTPIKRAAGERTVVTGLISGQNSPMCGRPVHLFAPAPLSPAVQAPVLADSLARVPSQRSLYSALMVCSSSSASSANSSDSDGVGGESLLTPVAPAPRRQRRATSGHRVFTLDSSATSAEMMHMCGSKQAHLLTAPTPSAPRIHSSSTTAPPPALTVPMISLPASPLPLPPLQRRSSASLSSMPSSQRSSLPTTPGHHLPSPSLASWGRGHDDFDAKSQQRSSAPPMTVFLDAASPVSGCSTTVHSYRSRSSSQALLPPTQRTSPVGPAFVRAPRPPTDVDDHCEQKSSQRGSHRPSILSDTTAGLVFGGNPDTASEVGFIPAMPCFQIRVSSPSESSSEFVLPPCAVASTSTTTTKGPVPTRSSCSRRASISSAPSFLQVTSTAATPAKMQRFDAAICEPGTAHTSRSDIHLNDDTDDGHPSGSVLNETVACAPLAMELIHFDSPLAECPEEDLPEPPRVSRHRHSQRHREAIRTSIPLIDIVPADEHSTSSSAPSVPLTPVSVDIALPQNVMVMQGSPVLTLRMPAEIPTLRLD